MLRSEVVWFPRLIVHLHAVLAKLHAVQHHSWVTWMQYQTIQIASQCTSYRELNQWVKDINEERFTEFIHKQVELVKSTIALESVTIE